MTFVFGLTLFAVIATGVATGLALFQYIVTPVFEGIAKLKELVDERSTRTK